MFSPSTELGKIDMTYELKRLEIFAPLIELGKIDMTLWIKEIRNYWARWAGNNNTSKKMSILSIKIGTQEIKYYKNQIILQSSARGLGIDVCVLYSREDS